MEVNESFSHSDLENIARALAHTSYGFKGWEIGNLLNELGMPDPESTSTKWYRLQQAFIVNQTGSGTRDGVLNFIRRSMKPSAHLSDPDRYRTMLSSLNQALSFCGLHVDETGKIEEVAIANTLIEAVSQAKLLEIDLEARGVHPDVLRFCKDELMNENYFHAVLEATKSIAEKIRSMTGLTGDGAVLIDAALSGTDPILGINALSTHSEWDEQKGFANLLKGVFGMFRNVTAHTPKLTWEMTRADAADVLTLVSLAHRRLDGSIVRKTVP